MTGVFISMLVRKTSYHAEWYFNDGDPETLCYVKYIICLST